MSVPAKEITLLLKQWRSGEPTALDQLLPLIYDELHSLARRLLSRENPGHTWQITELVHEVYLRLVGQPQPVAWQDRVHFAGAQISPWPGWLNGVLQAGN